MDLPNMLNRKIGHLPQHFALHSADYQLHQLPLVKPDPIMERSVSPHMSDHSAYSTAQSMPRSYGSPSIMQTSMHLPTSMPNSMSMPAYSDMPGSMASMHNMAMHHQHVPQQSLPPLPPVKAYPCSTCDKGFARRSDLARHERIHSGVRPHICDYPGCGKQFIQRSALTVHQRVHTGEKPHHCETCAKPFSDSSSLARHRRTHSGKRPHKCPYADCQKTFTRRTTLTRHQNQHSGTIEEAAAATAAALAASKAKNGGHSRSDGEHVSSHGSPMTTPSPGHRNMSLSPNMDVAASNGMGAPRHHPSVGDFQYMTQGAPLPPHLRVASPASASTAGYTTSSVRPTSHPTSYSVPAPILEPNLEQQSQAASSGVGGNNTHVSAVGWQPQHPPPPPPPHHHHLLQAAHNGAGYAYPEPETYHHHNAAAMNHHMYYTAPPQMRRPQGHDTGLVHMA